MVGMMLAEHGAKAGPAAATGLPAVATRPLVLRIDGRWYDATDWASRHPGGAYCLAWVAGFDVSVLFHTVHLFGRKSASAMLSRLPEVAGADLPTLLPGREPLVLPDIRRVPKSMQPPIFEDWLLGRDVGTGVASGPPEPFRKPAAGDARGWGAMDASRDTLFKLELEALLHRHFKSPAGYKASAEHWVRIGLGLFLTCSCLAGWAQFDVPATLLLPWAQWLLFSPAVHEASHHTLSTNPRVNLAAMFLGMPFIFNPLIWYPQVRATIGRQRALRRSLNVASAKADPEPLATQAAAERVDRVICSRACHSHVDKRYLPPACPRLAQLDLSPLLLPFLVLSSIDTHTETPRPLTLPHPLPPQHIVSHHQYPNDERLDVDLHHLRPARMHPLTDRDAGGSGVHFLFKGFFTTAGMSVLWPIRHLVDRPTARFYTLNTPAPAAVPKPHVALSLLPAAFVNLYPFWLVASGAANPALGLFLWLFPWLGTGAIWTVMTQVSHAQARMHTPGARDAANATRLLP